MNERHYEIAAKALREAGEFEAAEEMEKEAEIARSSFFHQRWKDRWENDTQDLY